MHTISTPNVVSHQLSPMQRLADAHRVLEIDLSGDPFLDAEGRIALRHHGWRIKIVGDFGLDGAA